MTGAILMAAGMALGGTAISGHGTELVRPAQPPLTRLTAPAGRGGGTAKSGGRDIAEYLSPPFPDPADSLYFAARSALNAGDHRNAARLFQIVREQFPASIHAADAYYWEAFALYRSGEPELLRPALLVLDAQQVQHPIAAARGDAPALRMRIMGELAFTGDAGAARVVAATAVSAEPRFSSWDLNARQLPDLFQTTAGSVARMTAGLDASTAALAQPAARPTGSGAAPPSSSSASERFLGGGAAVRPLVTDSAVRTNFSRPPQSSAPAGASAATTAATVRSVLGTASATASSGSAASSPVSGPADSATRAATAAGSNAAETNLRNPTLALQSAAASRTQAQQYVFFANPRTLPQGCPREEHELRLAALQAMTRLDATAAAPMLRAVLDLRDTCSLPLRSHAVTLLATRPVPATIGFLLEVARNDPNPDVRASAMQYLATARDPRGLEAVADLVFNSSPPNIREQAVRILGATRTPRAAELLRLAANRRDLPSEVRHQAITMLTRSPTAENLALLRELYPTVTDQRLKEQIIVAAVGPAPAAPNIAALERSYQPTFSSPDAIIFADLLARQNQARTSLEVQSWALDAALSSFYLRGAAVDDQEHIRWLLDIARDPDEPMAVRIRAARAAVPHAPAEGLIDLYEALPDPGLRGQLIVQLGRREAPQAVSKLIDIALGNDAPELRRAAIGYLGASQDPRAAAALLELVRR